MNVTLPAGTSVVDFPPDQTLVLTFGDGDVVIKLRSSKIVSIGKNGVIKIKSNVPIVRPGGGGGGSNHERTYSIKAGNAETR